MKYLLTRISFLPLLLLVSISLNAQPSKPVIDTMNVGWGWFELSLTNVNTAVKNTQWVIKDSTGMIVYDTRRTLACGYDQCGIIKSYTADSRDLTHKRIIGCAAAQKLSVMARYNLGDDTWSEYSDALQFELPMEPVRTQDTVRVVLWGQSHLRWGDECVKAWNFISPQDFDQNYNDGYQIYKNYEYDTYGHALQTELRRIIPGVPVVLFNYGKSGSQLDSGWLHHSSADPYMNVANIRMYDPDSLFGDVKKFPIAVFFHSNNDEYFINSDRYAQVVDSVIHRLTNLGVRVVFNSVHHSSAYFQDCYPGHPEEVQQAFFDAWDRQLDIEVAAHKGMVWKGLDLFHLYKSDTARFQAIDGQHPNITEGIDSVARLVAPFIRNAILATTPVTSSPEPDAQLVVITNHTGSASSIRYTLATDSRVRLQLYDLRGVLVHTLVDGVASSGTQQLPLPLYKLSAGMYVCVMKTGQHFVTQSFIVAD